MNDRFKFRVWSYEQKRMINSWDYSSKRDFLYGALIDHRFFGNGLFITMQSTDMKDKNGKLIYEGDILQQPQLPHKVVCEWYKDGFWLNGFMNGAKRELRNMHNWYEVIGNIYENKELLESEG